jgi:CRP/FNR family transcriptional regulator, cyclic AMP receptor protein
VNPCRSPASSATLIRSSTDSGSSSVLAADDLNERLLEALYVPVEKRVCRRLLELAALYPSPDEKPVIALTQETIAELAGAARATVNQVLRDEERRGTIELRRGKTRVLDLEALRRRAR